VKFCYDILTKNTIAEGSTLNIEEVEAKVECNSCGFTGSPPTIDGIYDHFQLPVLECPKCGSTLNIISGREFTLQKIKMVKSQTSEVK
jgi:hydrogenase nickel incorporation protein HypA/HybF